MRPHSPLAALSATILIAGCGPPSGVPSTADGRPERFTTRRVEPKPQIIGAWGPAANYVANDWHARFLPDGRMSVEGPGLKAVGEYALRGTTATVNYDHRIGRFDLSPDGQSLTFTTGVPHDPPVEMVREAR